MSRAFRQVPGDETLPAFYDQRGQEIPASTAALQTQPQAATQVPTRSNTPSMGTVIAGRCMLTVAALLAAVAAIDATISSHSVELWAIAIVATLAIVLALAGCSIERRV